MSNFSLKFQIVPFVFFILVSCENNYNNSETKETTSVLNTKTEIKKNTDEISIGNCTWMSKNLNSSTFRNGDSIPEIKSDSAWKRAAIEMKPACCSYNNDSSNDEKYGKLYNWFAITDPRGIAPIGWKVPNDEEWTDLINYLDPKQNRIANKIEAQSYIAGKKLKCSTSWLKRNTSNTNESGFTALPSGYRSFYGNFFGIGDDGIQDCAFWWTTSAFEYGNKFAYWRSVDSHGDGVGRGDHHKGFGFSVRCIKDN